MVHSLDPGGSARAAGICVGALVLSVQVPLP